MNYASEHIAPSGQGFSATYQGDNTFQIVSRIMPGSTTTSDQININTDAIIHARGKQLVKRARADSDLARPNSPMEHEGASPAKRSRRSSSHSSEGNIRLFACPYAKYDPVRFSGSNLQELKYRGCSQCYLTDIARVKQHLYRVHGRPTFYCRTCFESFKSHVALRKHAFRKTCKSRPCPFDAKMSDAQFDAIKQKQRSTNLESYWFDIFSVLFPEAPLPDSPYTTFENEKAKSKNAQLDEFVDFIQEQILVRGSGGNDLQIVTTSQQQKEGCTLNWIASNLSDLLQDMKREFYARSSLGGSPAQTTLPSPTRTTKSEDLSTPYEIEEETNNRSEVASKMFDGQISNIVASEIWWEDLQANWLDGDSYVSNLEYPSYPFTTTSGICYDEVNTWTLGYYPEGEYFATLHTNHSPNSK